MAKKRRTTGGTAQRPASAVGAEVDAPGESEVAPRPKMHWPQYEPVRPLFLRQPEQPLPVGHLEIAFDLQDPDGPPVVGENTARALPPLAGREVVRAALVKLLPDLPANRVPTPEQAWLTIRELLSNFPLPGEARYLCFRFTQSSEVSPLVAKELQRASRHYQFERSYLTDLIDSMPAEAASMAFRSFLAGTGTPATQQLNQFETEVSLTKEFPPWQPVQVPEQEQARTPIDQEAALPAVPEGMEAETVAALAAVVEELTALAKTEPESLLDDIQQLKDISQALRVVLAPQVAAVLNRYAGTAYTYAEKQEVAKQVNAMLRDLGLQLQSPDGEPVPLVVGTGGVRDREGTFVVGRGEGSTSSRYPKATLMPAPPKKPRGE
jgi:hypothetical protein